MSTLPGCSDLDGTENLWGRTRPQSGDRDAHKLGGEDRLTVCGTLLTRSSRLARILSAADGHFPEPVT